MNAWLNDQKRKDASDTCADAHPVLSRSWGKDHIAHSGRGGGTWGNGVRKKDIHKGAGPPTHARTAHAPSTRVRPKAAAPKVPAGG
eukprot:CAMPEP_0174292046 /NCGR_PEP_ID=MMETSP0809-20121228/34076_1 /TAXON_ID=73025 ORGANISM="Eutreptiella gymnastica-like, Strain CCMP1594" /NCGR_SAMPLE_ID=MMETSP0809 /ASSEMBLY_ACC=CAM_ASM_000658 /LENGTH=85 /DNA_ID=CAMNT_0015391827 /DNA_START=47 /DNA_END=301 /DNA_ORIENTATION=+